MEAPDLTPARIDCDVLVIGGGTAGTMAALTAAENGAQVLLLEKAHVRHSGALAMGMDGVNNAVIPGKATPAGNDGADRERSPKQERHPSAPQVDGRRERGDRGRGNRMRGAPNRKRRDDRDRHCGKPARLRSMPRAAPLRDRPRDPRGACPCRRHPPRL